jgi:uroporphyrinogen III methyltransferase/synthase
LGFDSITVSGAGDERIARTLLSLTASSEVQPVQSKPARERMTDSNASTNPTPNSALRPANPLPPNQPFTPYEMQQSKPKGTGLLWVVIALLFFAAIAGGVALNRRVIKLDQQPSHRQQVNDVQTAEMRVKTEQAVATVRRADAQIAKLEGKHRRCAERAAGVAAAICA